MKLINFFILIYSILLLASCCSGYGDLNVDPEYENICFIKLEDNHDSILVLKYMAKSDSLYPNKNLTDLKVSKIIPTEFYVKTIHKEYLVTINLNSNLDYWEDRTCNQSHAKITYSAPYLVKLVGGMAKISGSPTKGYNAGYQNNYSSYDRYDTLYLK
jgi:hypothetical protein